MSIVSDVSIAYYTQGSKVKTTPSGWMSRNAPCCHHNGHSPDDRGRGGFKTSPDGGASYHCFNCGFKASWRPGRNLSFKYKKLLRWLGTPDDTINKLGLQVLRENEGVETAEFKTSLPTFEEGKLPQDAVKISENTNLSKHFIKVVEYMQARELYLEDYPFHWTNNLGFRDRLIIPFYHEGTIVGYTARTTDPDKKPKYLANEPVDYVFNLDEQTYDKDFVLVFEGPIDAIYMGGCALLGSEISDGQMLLLNRLNKDVVVVPDRDAAGKKLVEDALGRGWSLSMPEWEDDIKDVGDAVLRYGRLYTLYSIVKAIESSPLKNRLRAKKWFITDS